MSSQTDTVNQIRFKAGRPNVTHAAAAALELAQVPDLMLLARHIHGDWGDVSEHDCLQNEIALLLDIRILSRYVLPTGPAIWIVTEADRSATTILLVEGE
ncbi:hypothetical protein [Paraburkholderia graminis]|uniref:Plasmid related protein n=1 Tax=Paraburkholderia graminis TaxID=60548 RepID=A0ABD5CBW8_9BURK|nr:hypothetical protein [Paraburkholderia graminis]MDR6202528.1 hypothetical protein [Paraburkholderia graminis]